MSPTTIFTCLGIGIIGGIVAALCGVGGGVVMVPAFVGLLGMTQKPAVATSLAVIIPTAIAASLQNARAGLVDWRVAAATAVSACVFSYMGAGWLRAMSNESLTRIFGVVLVVLGGRMLLTGRA